MKLHSAVRIGALSSWLAAAGCLTGPYGDASDGASGSGAGSVSRGYGSQAAGGRSGAGGRGGAGGMRATATAGAAGSRNGASGSGGARAAGSGGANAGGAGAAGAAGRAAAGSGGASGAGSGGAIAAGSGGAGAGGAGEEGGAGGTTGAAPDMNFFVTSATSATADLGGLEGADETCQTLAAAVGHGDKNWRAYLSAEDPETNAADRIGEGPYINALGNMLAEDKDSLHESTGDATFFVTEKGDRINGQWIGSPMPNQHDILTGTLRDGTVAAGFTCGDWTATTGNSQVGHSDGLGPNQDTSGMRAFWNSSHTGQCGNTQPGGGAGRFYCFVGP